MEKKQILNDFQSKKSRNILKNILESFYKGKGITDTVIYICQNKLIDDVNYALDNFNLSTMLDKDSIIILAQIIKIYLKTCNKQEKAFLDFLQNLNSSSIESCAKLLNKLMVDYNLIDANNALVSMKRYNNLKLTNFSESEIRYIFGVISGLNAARRFKEIDKDEKYGKIVINQKIRRYNAFLNQMYCLYKDGINIDEICQKIDNKPDTFYYNIMSISEYLDDEIASFSVKLASYNFEKYLSKKYKISLLYCKAGSMEKLCEYMYNQTKISYSVLSNQFNSYIALSPYMNNPNNKVKSEYRKKYLLKFLDVYANFYIQNKKNKRRMQREDYREQKVRCAESIVLDIINSNETIEKYCENKSIDKETINIFLEMLKRCNSYVMEKYNEYYARVYFNRIDLVLRTANDVVNLIKNGVETKNGIRKYDSLDYYSNEILSSLDITVLREKMEKEDYVLLARFIKQCIISNAFYEVSNQNIINTSYFINIEEGINREISLIEKKEIITWLNDHKIPFNSITFYDGIKRYIAGNLIDHNELSCDEKSNVKKLK